ncbi:Vacuolar protein sorting-associated protein 21 [Choanephora cucurbitarum]|uniref:Vacuolar protein sorting-associated protein 21 n=1 Tax=Choanephora cucurbitarum TaxID=101091 RepID=A0A1C7NJU8_9FUNG|nr:Vacuolar protein sorting-associated protein 21 [Choanephora cucurbitarum]
MEENGQIPSVKLVLLGESSVGKSSIVTRYATDTFIEGREATIGAAFLARICSTEQRKLKFEIWDTAGQERFHSLAPMYYRNALAAMVVFDITKSSSFERAKLWVTELKRQGSPHLVIALVGNKLDLDQESREVPQQEAEEYATEMQLFYVETSARLGTHIEHVFTGIADRIPEEQLNSRSNNRRFDMDHHLSDNRNSCAC